MRQITLFILALLLIIPFSVSAQQAVTLEVLQIEFWPEYDEPEMLVIYHIELSSDTELPVTLSFRIPTAAGDPYVLFVEGAGEQEYERQVEGEWAAITFTAEGRNIQLEYYDPGLIKDGEQRSYTYTWPGDYAVNSFQAIAQVPFDASGFITSPILGEGVSGVNGLAYRQGVIGSFQTGEQPSLTIGYQKASDILSINNPAIGNSVDEAPPSTSGSGDGPDWLVISLIGAGVAILGFGIYSFTQSNTSRRKPTRSRRRKRPSGTAKANVFCHQCGTQAHKGDKFCRECGQKLRG